MVRQLIKNDVPELWKQRAKAGLCPTCGKTRQEFNKGMVVYCSVKCRDEYASKYTWWTTLKEEVLTEKGKICANCGISEEKIKKETEYKNKEHLKKIAIEQKELIEAFRNDALIELSEDYEKKFKEIMDDEELAKKKWWHFPVEIQKKYKFNYFPQIPSFDVDHIKAIVNGGDEFDKTNLQVLCENCHKNKTKQDLLERKRHKIKNNKLNLKEN